MIETLIIVRVSQNLLSTLIGYVNYWRDSTTRWYVQGPAQYAQLTGSLAHYTN